MAIIIKRSNALRSADRAAARTGKPHTIKRIEGGFQVVEVKAEPVKRAPRRAVKPAATATGLPAPPDFTANTHKPHRAKLAALVAAAEAGDVAALMAIEIKPYSSSPKAMLRYRNNVVAAIQAGAEA